MWPTSMSSHPVDVPLCRMSAVGLAGSAQQNPMVDFGCMTTQCSTIFDVVITMHYLTMADESNRGTTSRH